MARTRPEDAANGETQQQEAKDRPVKVVRIRNIRGNIWANKTRDGVTLYNVTLDRLWKEDDQVEDGKVVKEGEWHQSASFGRDDLLLLAKVADHCHSWIFQKLQDGDRSF